MCIQAIEIFKILPPEGNHPHLAICLGNVSLLFESMGTYEEAEPYLIKSIAIYLDFIKNNLYTLHETEKEQLYSTIKWSFEHFYSFLDMSERVNSEKLSTTAYDIQLFIKAFLFDSTKRMIARIRSSKDTALIEDLNSWLILRDQLSKEYKEETAQKVNEFEKILAKKS